MGASRLQEARERLKKSQENLAAMVDPDGELGDGAGGGGLLGSERGGVGGALPRSKSIGNLRFSVARNNNNGSDRNVEYV